MHSRYLIIGGGMTAAAAVRGIRDLDSEGTITVISNDAHPPYKRPPLTKDLWKGKPLDRIFIDTGKHSANVQLGRTVSWLNLSTNTAVDDRGDSYTFDKLLLATGVRPRQLASSGGRVIHYRTLHDFLRLRELADRADRFAIIGSGFIGSELAASLAANDKQVTLIARGSGIGDGLFPAGLVANLNDYYRERGVMVHTTTDFQKVDDQGDHQVLHSRDASTQDERALEVDAVIAGIGTEPNTELAASAGLEVDNGILVDEYLRTNCPDVFAAGDVASIWQPELGMRRRFEHEDNANVMGRFAGKAMAGDTGAYQHQPFFYSDLFDLGYEAVGELDPELDIAEEWKTPWREGVVYYLRDDVIRGVLLWNVWEQVDHARSLIAGQVRYSRRNASDMIPVAA